MTHRFRTADKASTAAQVRASQYASREHRQTRRNYEQRMVKGEMFPCWRALDPSEGPCLHPNDPIQQGTRWHLGHDRQRHIRGPEHPDCNLRNAARDGNARQRAGHPTFRQSRRWV